MKAVSRLVLIATLILFLLVGCTKSSDEDSGSESQPSGNSGGDSKEITTDCGIVSNGELRNPISRDDGEQVRIMQVISGNLISIQGLGPDSGGPVLLKLHGLSSGPENRQAAAKNLITSMNSANLTFFKASPDCNVTLDGGGQGVIGQLVNSNGTSFSERLVKAGLVDVDSADACGGDQIAGCLSALKGTGIESKGEIRDFLWKPLSDTKGPVLVIHELHCNTDLFVNGVQLQYAGAGNGRCGTFVGTKSGCAYGNNVRVEVIDKATGQPYSHQGQPYVTIPSGCSRFEFK